jgi:hypothetical protein
VADTSRTLHAGGRTSTDVRADLVLVHAGGRTRGLGRGAYSRHAFTDVTAPGSPRVTCGMASPGRIDLLEGFPSGNGTLK